MFDGILTDRLFKDISNSIELKEKCKLEIILKNTKKDDVGEVFLLPVRIQLHRESTEDIPFDVNTHNVAHYTILRNDSSYSLNITF